MQKIIRFFLDNVHLNHFLLFFLLISGVYSYIKIPKEMFPDMALNKIIVSGAYAGSSANTLDKMVVRDIEDDVSAVSGVSKIESVISPGKFSVILTLDSDSKEIDVLNRVKDAIANVGQNLPSDMNMPTARSLVKIRDFMKLSISSETLDFDTLLAKTKEIRSKLLKFNHVTEVNIYGDSDKEIEIKLDAEAIRAYELNPNAIIDVIRNLSYTFPIGDIDDSDEFIFVSTINGKQSVQEWGESLITVGDKTLLLKDIASINIYHPRDVTMASFNGQKAINVVMYKDMVGDSIAMSKEMYKYVETIDAEFDNVNLDVYHDSSIPIKNRLSLIISNLTLGLILIFFTMYFLVNRNTAIVVSLGIPFSFIIGLLFLYIMGYSLNLISLIGALLVVGIAVDDAVVVSENIQRHIDEGMTPNEAAFKGAKEVAIPVILATMTTVVAFLPMFMLTGEMGLFIRLIPIVVIAVLFGSLLESFLFLPLHAKTILKKDMPSLDWTYVDEKYEKILHKLLHYKKTTLLVFFVGVPILTFGVLKTLSFQFFPTFDTDMVYITGKLKTNTTLEESFDIAHEIELDLYTKRDEYNILSISNLSGKRKTLQMDWETATNAFYITIELKDRVPVNFVEAYVNPFLDFSFNFNDPDKTRVPSSFEIADQLREFIKPYRAKYDFTELSVMERKVGLIKTDIELNIIGSDGEKIQRAIGELKAKMQSIESVNNVMDNIRYGKMEYKIKLNHYAETLGLTESFVASSLSSYFLGSRKAMSFDDDGVVTITTEFEHKNSINQLRNFDLALSDGRFVSLQEVCDFVKVQDYEKIEKDDGLIVKTVSANVDKQSTTSTKVLEQLEPLLEEIRASGLEVAIAGEKEKNDQLKQDMIRAIVVAMFLMLILLLLKFKKMKYAFMILSVIPASVVGALIGHAVMGENMGMTSVIGLLGLAGVVINDGIIMLDFLHSTHNSKTFYRRAKQRLRPILITTITTFMGLSTLIFFASGQALIMKPLAISLGFGLMWGTLINLLYLPTLYALVNKIDPEYNEEDEDEIDEMEEEKEEFTLPKMEKNDFTFGDDLGDDLPFPSMK